MYSFLLKGNALYLCQSKNWAKQPGSFWWFWPKVILLVKCSVLMISICLSSSSSMLYSGWPPLSPSWKHPLRICYMLCRNQSVSRSRALPSLLACPSLTMIPSSMERTRGLIKNKGDLFFWHVKIFHFFFSPRLFLIHTSMKNGLNRPFFFFFFFI